jgi:Transcriptional regulator, AbiEi antitoxin, Type IV TA system
MKTTEKLKHEEFEAKIEALLKELCTRVPFLKVKSFKRIAEVFGSKPDWLVEMQAGDHSWVWVVEGRRHGQPREVRNGLLQLRSFLDQTHRKNCYGLLVAPFLSEESARLCTEAGIGYADLAGNARLAFDQVFIETHGADNPFREKREKRSLFSPRAAQVLRVLLTPPLRAWKVTELAVAAGVSFGQISNVRKLLLDREWATVSDTGLRLSKPEELARAWQSSYEQRLQHRETAYTLLHGEALDTAMRSALAEAGKGQHAVLASYSAARWFAPYARQATQFFYADKKGAEILKQHLQLQPVSRGENIVVLEPREDDVFSGRVEAAPGIWCSGLVQTWLDLSVAGERGSEAAEHLLRGKLSPAWKEVAP